MSDTAATPIDLRLIEYEGLNYTPAVPLAYACMLELIQAGLASPTLTLDWNANAIVAYDGEIAVGLIVWSEMKHDRNIFITTGYVVPSHRERGVYSSLWDATVAKAKKLKVLRICLATHVDNARMRDVSRRLGGREEVVQITFDIDLGTAESKPA